MCQYLKIEIIQYVWVAIKLYNIKILPCSPTWDVREKIWINKGGSITIDSLALEEIRKSTSVAIPQLSVEIFFLQLWLLQRLFLKSNILSSFWYSTVSYFSWKCKSCAFLFVCVYAIQKYFFPQNGRNLKWWKIFSYFKLFPEFLDPWGSKLQLGSRSYVVCDVWVFLTNPTHCRTCIKPFWLNHKVEGKREVWIPAPQAGIPVQFLNRKLKLQETCLSPLRGSKLLFRDIVLFK